MSAPTCRLVVDIVRAQGLKHMNHFTGDHPYCACEVQHTDGSTTKIETKPVTEGDTLNPVWAERFECEKWQPGETLQFIILDKGLLGSKTEGKAELPSEIFYPHGFNGPLPISGLPEAFLEVAVQAVEDALVTTEPVITEPVTTEPVPTTQPAPKFTGTVAYIGTTYSAPIGTAHVPGHGLASGVQTYAAPMSPVAYAGGLPMPPSSTGQSSQMQPGMLSGTPVFTMAPATSTSAPCKLSVSIFQAFGLNHMNHFTGDHPYVVCEVRHLDKNLEKTRAETRPVMEGDTLNPAWDEALELEPWYPGEPLEFTVLDKGLIGSKTEGRAVLPAELFTLDPSGFAGNLRISGLQGALLNVAVQVLPPSAGAGDVALATGATDAPEPEFTAAEPELTEEATKKKSKKLKTKKKSRGCC
jgi:hypothetical protein